MSHEAAPAAPLCSRVRVVPPPVVGRQRLRSPQAPSAGEGRQAPLVWELAPTPLAPRLPQAGIAAAPGPRQATAAKTRPSRPPRPPSRQLAPQYVSCEYESASQSPYRSAPKEPTPIVRPVSRHRQAVSFEQHSRQAISCRRRHGTLSTDSAAGRPLGWNHAFVAPERHRANTTALPDQPHTCRLVAGMLQACCKLV